MHECTCVCRISKKSLFLPNHENENYINSTIKTTIWRGHPVHPIEIIESKLDF